MEIVFNRLTFFSFQIGRGSSLVFKIDWQTLLLDLGLAQERFIKARQHALDRKEIDCFDCGTLIFCTGGRLNGCNCYVGSRTMSLI